MASILSTATSQLQVDANAVGAGTTVSIVDLTLSAQPGGVRLATVTLAVTPSGGSTVQITTSFLFSDEAFTEYDLFGAPKGQNQQGQGNV